MKKTACLVVSLALSILCAASACAQGARVNTGSGALNMRRSAEQGAIVLERIPNGSKVDAQGEEGEWSRIVYKGKSGYVKTKYLVLLNEEEPAKENEAAAQENSIQAEPPVQTGGTAWINTGKGTLNLRKKADAKSAVLVKVPDGARVQVEEAGRVWTKLTYQGKSGYVKTEYLRLDSQLVGTVIYPNGDQLLMRGEKDDQSQSVLSVHAAQPMTILEVGDEWLKVSAANPYAGEAQGYVRLQDVSDFKEAPAQGMQPFYAHMIISSEELALGAALEITLQHDEGAQCTYTLYHDGKAILRELPAAYDTVSYRAKESGEYRLVAAVQNAQGNQIRCEKRFTVLSDMQSDDGVILYSQKDGWWLDKKYGRSNLDQSGCAIFTLSAALRILGFDSEGTGAQLLAKTYPMYLTESGTVTENLLAAAARDFGFTAGRDRMKNKDEIVQQFHEGAVFSFSVASGHIALAAGLSEDGTKVKILDSAPSATYERIEGARLYYIDEQGGFAAANTLWDIPSARYYFETNEFGGLEYYLDLEYVAKRGVRMIKRR
ncbi:MAG: SH3 domain-containing protein [Clostridia bacterium]|nr:SH3 domain-containing protein [Clostridia bacterium]